MLKRWLALSVCILVIIAGCGEDSDAGNGSDTTDKPTATTASDTAPSGDEPEDASDDEGDSGSAAIEFTTVRGARPGSTADVVVLTEPNTECSITYTDPDGNVGEMRGLEPKTSSGTGRLTWGWKIDPETTPGEGTVAVTCGGETAETAITIQ